MSLRASSASDPIVEIIEIMGATTTMMTIGVIDRN